MDFRYLYTAERTNFVMNPVSDFQAKRIYTGQYQIKIV